MSMQPADKMEADDRLRQVPVDVEAEQALLGAILINNDAFERVASFLAPEHFHEPLHQRIFEAIGRVVRKGQLASPVTLRPFFSLDPSSQGGGGADQRAERVRHGTSGLNAP
ncbi:MAG: DnaB-like helicase N-terminal domain-containing protein, partial [Alphaproteobacteria bacterium]